MPNNDRTRADGDYVTGFAMSSDGWADLDRKIHNSWNGDRGGAYTPTEQVAIGGSGLVVTGPTRLSGGGTIYATEALFKLRNGAWPQLKAGHAGGTREIVQVISACTMVNSHLWTRNHPYGGLGTVALSCRGTSSREIERPELYVPLQVVNGARLTKVEVRFRVGNPRAVTPVAMPKFRVLRMSVGPTGVLVEPLKASVDGTGFDSPPIIASPADWYANGAAQSFVYVCDQNNIIDDAGFVYILHLVEEQGVSTPDEPFDGIRLVERKRDVDYTVQNIVSFNDDGETLDGNDSAGGERVLAIDTDAVLATGKSAAISAKNGLWVTTTDDNWGRAADLDEQADFTRNWIVRVNGGTVNANSTWMCVEPSSDQKVDLIGGLRGGDGSFTNADPSADRARPRIIPAPVRGNIYHALIPTFEVTDLRFQ